ncbi:MAG: hypothetical protein AAF713_02795 [Pseudomonadota bacterium]
MTSKNTGLQNLKDTGAGFGYGGLAGGDLIGAGHGAVKQVQTGTKWTKLPKSSGNAGKLETIAENLTTGVHDVAAPFKVVEYYADAQKVFTDYADHAKAQSVVRDHQDVASLRAETGDPHAARRLDSQIRLGRPRKILADKTLAKRGHFQRIGHTKGIVGFLKYGAKTGLAVYHFTAATIASVGAKGLAWFSAFGGGFKDAVSAASKASTLGFSAVGMVFDPVSAAYYTKKAVDSTRRLKALAALSAKTADVKSKVSDPELSAVVKRLERKCDLDGTQNRWERIANGTRAGLYAIGGVGSVTGFLAAVGVKAAVVTGLAATVAAWPVLLGVAGTAALVTSGCLLAKAVRNRNSRLEKAVIREANVRAQAETEKHRDLQPSEAERTKIDPNSEIYHSRVEKALQRTEDLDLLPGFDEGKRDALLARFKAKTLTAADAALIADWTEGMRVARDTRATVDLLVTRLFEEADAPLPEESGEIEQAHQLLSALGVPDEKVTAVRDAIREVHRQQESGVVDREKAADAVAAVEKIIAEALLLR